jgi:hypothetical protein
MERAEEAIMHRANLMSKVENILVAVALFFSLLPFAGYETARHRWAMLSGAPTGALTSGVVAAAAWLGYLALRRRLRSRTVPRGIA